MFTSFGLGGITVILGLFLVLSLRVLREYERGVVFQLGRFWKVKGPGLVLVIPIIQQMVKVDLRTVTMDVPSQDVISRDNVSVKVNAVVYFRVIDPQRAIINVEHYYTATSQLAQTMLRSILGKHELDDMLAEREKLNLAIQKALDAQTDSWGIKVANVEIKNVDLNENMVRAIAKQAEAERERRAKVIAAQGELQASATLAEAAKMLASEPVSLQLRYLQTVTEIAAENNSTTIFPLPMDLLRPFMDMADRAARTREDKVLAAAPAPAALPAADRPMPAHELGDLMQRLKGEAAQKKDT
jgi:regulator of protease activity HflC (stomatin/prohibitin superfamily)